MRAEAAAAAATVHRQAEQEGYQAGLEKGLSEGRQTGQEQAFKEAQETFGRESREVLAALQTAWQQFDQRKEELMWRAEQGTVVLAVAIAEKVVKQTGLLRREAATENVKAALSLLAQTTNVVVKLNARDLEHLTKLAGENEKVLGRYAGIKVEADEGIEPGGCLLVTSVGEIDGQLETQVKRIADELLTAVGQG